MKDAKRFLVWPLVCACVFAMGMCALAEDGGEPVRPERRVSITTEELLPMKGLDENWMNILLLGTDSESDQQNTGYADAIIVMSVHRQTGQIKMTSVNRDLWVDIYQIAAPNRINAAHAYGGPLLTIRTVNEVLGLNITQFISVNFNGFEAVVDAIGGVALPLTEGECEYINHEWPYEPQLVFAGGEDVLLNGAQALWYTRIDVLSDGAVARVGRQRRMLMTLLYQMMNGTDAKTVLSVSLSFLPYVSTNLSLTDMVKLLKIVMSVDDLGFESAYLPLQGSYRAEESDGLSKVIFDAERIRRDCFDFIYGGNE